MFGAPTVTNHSNKSYKMASGGVVPDASLASVIMPEGTPQPPAPDDTEKPDQKQSPPGAFQQRPDNAPQWGSHR